MYARYSRTFVTRPAHQTSWRAPRLRVAIAAVAMLLLVPLAAQAQGLGGSMTTAGREAILLDSTTGAVLFEKGADQLMPPASMSKIMTAFMAFEALEEGRLSLTDTLPVSEKAWRMGGSKMFVEVGTRVSVEDLLRGIIIQSGNDACIVIAEALAGSEAAFADQMTARARDLGLEHSTFRNATGWPEEGHLMTARELARLAEILIERFPQYYHYYSETEFTYHDIRQGNRNPLLYRNVGADGLKTGHTEESGYSLTASAERDGRRLILVVTGLSSMQERAQESDRLLDWGFRSFENVSLFRAGETVDSAEVWLGSEVSVPLTVTDDIVVTLPREARRSMEARVVYDGPVAAPIVAGQPVGRLVLSAGSMPPQTIPLVAGRDVPRAGMVGRVFSTLSYLVLGAGGAVLPATTGE